MSKVVFGMAMSLDGFVNDKNGSVSRLYPDFEGMVASDHLQESIRTTGAVVMGRHSYDMGNGDFTGYEYQVPIFVLTHHAPEAAAKGENDRLKIHFVSDGAKSAVEQAKAAAGDKIVTIVGGADTGQQCIREGLIDEIEVNIIPVLLGEGLRMFDQLGAAPTDLALVKLIENVGGGTTLLYRVVK